ncbi:protein of unknown function [Shewanella benthica]|uniref:Uncharacterized protein n=1 Tax=Shewanella benthica TaxID=43661 RepID=A0A330MCG7_9GAMM|nr:protein of unknown function [Shewanella benthica]
MERFAHGTACGHMNAASGYGKTDNSMLRLVAVGPFSNRLP